MRRRSVVIVVRRPDRAAEERHWEQFRFLDPNRLAMVTNKNMVLVIISVKTNTQAFIHD